MRLHGRIDANQRAIVEALRQLGATVQSLADVGKGCPDLLVGYKGRNLLVEVKDGEKCASRQMLTPAEADWGCRWRGQLVILRSVDEAVSWLLKEIR